MSEEPITSDVEAAFQHGAEQIKVLERSAQHEAHAIIPAGSKLAQLPLRKQAHPEFIEAVRVFHDPEDFCAYVNQFSDSDSRIWFNTDGRFVCVLDDHMHHEAWENQQARHGDHQAVLELKHSPEWLDWTGSNTQTMGQAAFGEFIEDHVVDFIRPDAADMLEIATQFDATKHVNFKSGYRQQDGQQQLVWQEEIEGKVVGSDLVVPKEFVVALRPFYGCDRYKITCMFRYRFGDGKLRLFYKMIGLDAVLETAIDRVAKEITEATEIKPALGSH